MNERRRMTGIVTSNKMQKTVVVEIGRTFRHPLYRKVIHLAHRVKAHDELGCEMGDEVQIVESRPLSAQKHWVVESIVKKQAVPVGPIVKEEAVETNEPDEAEIAQGE
jgi:small subunit ribosomal protein S17